MFEHSNHQLVSTLQYLNNMFDAEHLAPSVEQDITTIDFGRSESPFDEPAPRAVIKNEPEDDEETSSNTSRMAEIIPPPSNNSDYPPLPELGSPALDEEEYLTGDLAGLDHDFEQSIALAQQEFNRQSQAEETPVIDEAYEDALEAVDQKRKQVAKIRSMRMDVTADEIELQRLEDRLLLARKNKMRAEQHVQQEREESSMFFPEGEYSDDDEIEMSQTPARREAPAMVQDFSVIDISDDEEQDIKAKVKLGQKRKDNRKTSVTPRAAKKPKPNRRVPPRKIEMLNMGSLIRNDIVGDAKANQGLRQQPSLGAGKDKQKALKALIASIPEDERSTARGEKQELSKACSVFSWKGRGSMKADEENGWKLKGMTSSLRHFQLLSVAKGVEKERGSTAPFGGMLADTMGYGKVSM